MGGPRKLGHERRGVGTSLKVGMRSDRANYLKTGLKLVPTRVRYGVKMTPQGSLIVQFGPLSLALHPLARQLFTLVFTLSALRGVPLYSLVPSSVGWYIAYIVYDT